MSTPEEFTPTEINFEDWSSFGRKKEKNSQAKEDSWPEKKSSNWWRQRHSIDQENETNISFSTLFTRDFSIENHDEIEEGEVNDGNVNLAHDGESNIAV